MKSLISFLLLYNMTFSSIPRKTDDDDVKITKKNDDMTNSQLECSHFTDCFNCSSFSFKKCGWNGNECFLVSNSAQKIDLSEIENSCYNYYDDAYKTSRCGKLSYSFEGKKIKSISLPKTSSNSFNDPTMLCVYTFNNTKQKKISFEFELEIDGSANVQYEVIYNDNKNHLVNVNNEVDTKFNNVKSLIVRFSSNYAFSQQPFEIELENDDDDDDDDDDKFNSLYVILIIVVLVILISCIIWFVVWYRKKQKKKIENFNDNNIIINNNNNNIENEKSSLNNKKANNDKENLEINENDIKNNNNKNNYEGDKLNINKKNTKNETENPDSLINEEVNAPNIIDGNNLVNSNNILNAQIDNDNNINKEQNLNHDKIINFIEKNFNFANYHSINEKLNHKCSICIEEFKDDDNVAITPCHHIFHNNCIHNWLIKNNSEMKCPNCNYIFI